MIIVHYNAMNKYNQKEKRFMVDASLNDNDSVQAEKKKQADTLGWLMMSIGVYEITEKTVDEIIFRTKFLDFCWGSSYFVGNPSDTDLRQLFKNHLGLKIEVTNTGLKNIGTRHKFMVAQLNSIEERILKQMNN